MNTPHHAPNGHPSHHLLFASLGKEGVDLVFPCDDAGQVDLDALSDAARNRYLYAHTLIGCEFARPAFIAAQRAGS